MRQPRALRIMVGAVIAHECANYRYPDEVVDEGIRRAGMMPLSAVGAVWLSSWGIGTALVLGLVAGALYVAYDHSLSVKNGEWQARWNAGDAGVQKV